MRMKNIGRIFKVGTNIILIHGKNGCLILGQDEDEDNIALSEIKRILKLKNKANMWRSCPNYATGRNFPNFGKNIVCADPVEYPELFEAEVYYICEVQRGLHFWYVCWGT